jgi:hypothetical protein
MMHDKEEVEFVLAPEVQAQLDADPELAAAYREVGARLRQAVEEYNAGRFKTLEDAMRSVGATRVDEDDD